MLGRLGRISILVHFPDVTVYQLRSFVYLHVCNTQWSYTYDVLC